MLINRLRNKLYAIWSNSVSYTCSLSLLFQLMDSTDNNKRYGAAAYPQAPSHRRTASISQHFEGLLPGPDIPLVRPVGTPNVVEADVFPPLRAQAQDPSSNFLPFIAEDIAFEEEYEEYLSDLGIGEQTWAIGHHSATGGTSAWHRLPELAVGLADGISDSESVVSIGEIGDDARLDVPSEGPLDADDNVNNWEVRFIYTCRCCMALKSL
jgi:hypothetical protein